jgi:hypothetical protein
VTTRRVDQAGTISFATARYKAGRWLAGQTVEIVCEAGLVQIFHRVSGSRAVADAHVLLHGPGRSIKVSHGDFRHQAEQLRHRRVGLATVLLLWGIVPKTPAPDPVLVFRPVTALPHDLVDDPLVGETSDDLERHGGAVVVVLIITRVHLKTSDGRFAILVDGERQPQDPGGIDNGVVTPGIGKESSVGKFGDDHVISEMTSATSQ